jgi:hypothetical protein
METNSREIERFENLPTTYKPINILAFRIWNILNYTTQTPE